MITRAALLAAALRLLGYYNGNDYSADNPGGMSGVGGMATNWEPCIQDIGTVANGVGEVAGAISAAQSTIGMVWDAATTVADPGAGKLRATTGTPAVGSYSLLVSATDLAGADISVMLSELGGSSSTTKARARLVVVGDAAKYLDLKVTGVSGAGAYRTIAVTCIGGPGGFAAGDAVALGWGRTGDKGDTGATGSLSGGNLTGALNETAVTLASAATTDIGAAAGNAVRITGTTAITALGMAQAGARRVLTFAGALTLTHNAATLILPGAASIVTAAGDVAVMESLGAGNWRCIGYVRAAALPLFASGGNMAGPVTATSNAVAAVSNVFTINCAAGNEFDCGTVTAASTIANPINPPAVGLVQPLSIKWTQDATGGRTMSFGSNCINVGGISANTAANKVNFAVGKIYPDGKFYYSLVKGA